jgi:hypothetical protein
MSASLDKREVVAWISYKAAQHYVVDIGSWAGGGTDPEREPKLVPYHEALHRAVVARRLRRGGDWHQDAKDGIPVFDDGAIGTFSWRAWGGLLAAIWSAEDGRHYTYLDFYMDIYVENAGMTLSPPD